MKISLIAAVSPDGVIGRDGDLPWRYPADMKHFMDTTDGHPCIMGRRTYESFPRRPLPRRLNLVLTRDPHYPLPAAVLRFSDLTAALDHCRALGAPVVFVCGGESVYRESLPLADELVLTHVPDRVQGDTHFPEWSAAEWEVVAGRQEGPLRFCTYRRRRPSPGPDPIREGEETMLHTVPAAPPDPILGLAAAFAADANPRKVNLGVGEFRDEEGDTPVLESVRLAERRVVDGQRTKRYLPIDGTPEYAAAVRGLLFGADPELDERCATVQAPGGTGALRLAGDFLHAHFPRSRLWLSEPTWANHPRIFAAAGLEVAAYRYYDDGARALDFDGLCAALGQVPAGDVVLLHACCHNPTGADPVARQWERLGDLLAGRGVLPLVDFAYQGFGDGLAADAAGLRALRARVPELFVASSFSKNFGLYRERVGALTAVAATPAAAANVLSQLKVCVRTSFSNPPAHGSAIVTEILGDGELRQRWDAEVGHMRDRINGMRALLVDKLREHGAAGDYGFIARQRGMFSFSGLTAAQVKRLREEFAVYLVGAGRINVAGITAANVDYLCAAIAAVV